MKLFLYLFIAGLGLAQSFLELESKIATDSYYPTFKEGDLLQSWVKYIHLGGNLRVDGKFLIL